MPLPLIPGDLPRNEDLPAGAPMHFACAGCGAPIWVPEMYIAKPACCPDCGGEWSRVDGHANLHGRYAINAVALPTL